MKGFSIQKILFFVPIVLVVLFAATPFHKINAVDCPEGQYCVLAPIPNFEGPITSSFKVGDYVVAIFKVGIGLAGVLAVIMIIIGGISYMMSEMVGSKEEAKGTITNAIFGLLLALGAYAILNTINPDILCFRFLGSDCGQQGGGQQNNGGNNNGGGQNNGGGNVTPPVVPNPPVVDPNGAAIIGTIAGIEADANDGTIDNSCDSRQPGQGCGNNACQQYVNMINTVAGNDQELRKVMKAIMAVESECNINIGSPAGACGLFQLRPTTADLYSSGCTNVQSISCNWLKNPNNAQASICIAKNFITALKQHPDTNGRWRNVFASYNGAIDGITPSSNCEGDMVSCLNGSNIKQWECPWDNDEHTDPNEGFAETRNYVPEVSYCLINPQAWTGETSFTP